jgi:integrase
MSTFHDHVSDYLRVRRALGFKLAFHGAVLPQFASYLESAGATTLTVELAVVWAGLPEGVAPISLSHRLGAVRGFARYLKTIDPATEVPPTGIWPTKHPRPAPYLWAEEDVARLLGAARGLQPRLRASSMETLLGLLAASGMRVGEALALARDDVDLGSGVLTVRDAKFGRSRYVPLHPSTTAALGRYAEERDELLVVPTTTAFFVRSTGAALGYDCVHGTFRALTTALGLRKADQRPRVHDLRHSFVVRTLVNWYRAGVDVRARMVVLSDYLGHVNIEGTYWYFSAAPELMELVAAGAQGRLGPLR